MRASEINAMLSYPADTRGECDECGGYRELWYDSEELLSFCTDCWAKVARRKEEWEVHEMPELDLDLYGPMPDEYCPDCDSPLFGAAAYGSTCPECGAELESRELERT